MENQKLFVGNLKFETTKEELNELFSHCGTVKAISLRPKKGFAFVEMSKPEEAITAIQKLDQSDFKDRPLRITLEIPKKEAKTVTRRRFVENSKKHAKNKM